MTQKVWLVTGCSSGLGNQLIRSIIARGDKAIATARNASALIELADAGAATIELDVTVSEDILKEKASEAIGKFGRIDVVVHNAGKFQMGCWEDLTSVAYSNRSIPSRADLSEVKISCKANSRPISSASST